VTGISIDKFRDEGKIETLNQRLEKAKIE